MHARMLVALAGLMVWLSASAQEHPPFCTSPLLSGVGDASGHLAFAPDNPASGQPVTITAGRHIFVPADISAEVGDRVIDVYVTGHPDGFTTPAGDMCLSTVLPSLAAGSYTVNAYSIDSTLPGDPPQLFLSQPFSVSGGVVQAVQAPSTSPEILGALGVLLTLTAFLALRAKRRDSRTNLIRPA